MTLRYMPAEAGPFIKQAQNKAAELETQFNRLFSSVGYLDDDSNKLLYRPIYFSQSFGGANQELVWSIYKQCSFGKTHRSFGAFHDLYMIQMNGLNFARALTGPGVHYKDGKLARTYLHRILDTSNEMNAELAQLQRQAAKLQKDLNRLPNKFDTEWEKRYNHMQNLVGNLLNDMAACVRMINERGDLGEKILSIWFPEEVEEDEEALVSAQSMSSGVMETQTEQLTQSGTQDNPYVITPGIYDVKDLLHMDRRGQPTFFKVNVSEGGTGKHYAVRYSNDRNLDFDTHVRARQGDRVIFTKQETRDYTPHKLNIVPTNHTDNIQIEIQYWEHHSRPNTATLEVKLEQWTDDGTL